MLRLVVQVGDKGGHPTSSVVVFRATDFAPARARALELGRQMETAYLGSKGDEVTCRLRSVETLDLLGATITDGREVYAEADIELEPGLALPADDDPSTVETTQSGV